MFVDIFFNFFFVLNLLTAFSRVRNEQPDDRNQKRKQLYEYLQFYYIFLHKEHPDDCLAD